jgi:hypothetical protein
MGPGDAEREYINRWIRLKRADGTGKALYRHWILGKEDRKKSPRWSVIRAVLGRVR